MYVCVQITKVLLGGSWRVQWWRRGVEVHISGHAETPTLPAAPSLARRTRSVGYWTPSTETERGGFRHMRQYLVHSNSHKWFCDFTPSKITHPSHLSLLVFIYCTWLIRDSNWLQGVNYLMINGHLLKYCLCTALNECTIASI